MPLTDSRSGSREQERPEDRLARLLQPLQPTQNLVERRRELIELMESGAWYLRYFSSREMNQAHEHLDLCNRMLQIGEAQDILARPRVWVNSEEPPTPVPPMRSPYASLQWEEPQATGMFGVDRNLSMEDYHWATDRTVELYEGARNLNLVGTTISASTPSPSRSSNPGDSVLTSETLSSTLREPATSPPPQPPRTSRRRDGTSTAHSQVYYTRATFNDPYRSEYRVTHPMTAATFNVGEPAYNTSVRDLWAETSKVWYNISLEHAKKVGVTIES